VIASVAFRNFKALRSAQVMLGRFNLLIGPSGSGKTSLIEAILRLRTLARLPFAETRPGEALRPGGPEITFRFEPPHDGLEAVMACVSEDVCDLLRIIPDPARAGGGDWPGLRSRLLRVRSYRLDHEAMAAPAALATGGELAGNAGNLAAVLATRRREHPEDFARFAAEVRRILPEFDDLRLEVRADDTVRLEMRLAGGADTVGADNLSQGTLCALAILALAFDPEPPPVVCIEEPDRGIHPRSLREMRDALYRLSHPEAQGEKRAPVQVIATTHSPGLLDLFRDHPDEVIVAERKGREARFSRLSDLPNLNALLEEGSLGDLWFTGLLGGVPEER
jgi:predicted ATPase